MGWGVPFESFFLVCVHERVLSSIDQLVILYQFRVESDDSFFFFFLLSFRSGADVLYHYLSLGWRIGEIER